MLFSTFSEVVFARFSFFLTSLNLMEVESKHALERTLLFTKWLDSFGKVVKRVFSKVIRVKVAWKSLISLVSERNGARFSFFLDTFNSTKKFSRHDSKQKTVSTKWLDSFENVLTTLFCC